MHRLLFCFLLFSLLGQNVQTQITDRLHWVFPVDSVEQIKLEVVDPYTVVNWEGDKVMVTSEITVHNASKGIMKFFIEENRRYDIVDTVMAQVMTIDSYTSRRAPIESKGQPCHETVKVTILVPNSFVQQSNELWVKTEEEEEENK